MHCHVLVLTRTKSLLPSWFLSLANLATGFLTNSAGLYEQRQTYPVTLQSRERRFQQLLETAPLLFAVHHLIRPAKV